MLFISGVPANGQKTLYFVALITSWTGWATHHQQLNKLNKTFLTINGMTHQIKFGFNLADWLQRTPFDIFDSVFIFHNNKHEHSTNEQNLTTQHGRGTILWKKIHIPVLQSVCTINILILGNDVYIWYHPFSPIRSLLDGWWEERSTKTFMHF